MLCLHGHFDSLVFVPVQFVFIANMYFTVIFPGVEVIHKVYLCRS